MHRLLRFLAATAGVVAALTVVATAGGAGSGLTVIFVADPAQDRVFRLQDFDENGDFDQNGETVVFYDGAAGPFALPDPVALATDPADQAFVGDRTLDRILVLSDADESGAADGVGESAVYFDGTPGGNASGVLMPEVTGLALRILGTLWVTSTNPDGSSSVIRLRDANSDGDANDVGEARVVLTLPGAGAGIPAELTSLDVGYDGLVYVVQNGPAYAPGLYRLVDLNGNGVIDLPNELQAAWLPNASGADLLAAEVGEAGEWYLLDRGNDVVRLGFDVNSDGGIDDVTEAAPFWSIGLAGGFADMAVAVDGGALYLGDLASPSRRVLYAEDTDASSAIDPLTETFDVQDAAASPVDISEPRSLATDFHDHEEVGDAYCTGDSPLCPCGNLGSAGTGCANSIGVGATLEGTGTDGIANDDLVLEVTQLPPGAPALLFVGTAAVNGGLGAPFGDGLRCVGGAVVRLGVRFADPIGFAEWGPGYAAQQGWAIGDTRYFQVWYRNLAGPCGNGFNLSNGLQVTFTQ
jgi:hypothetical protein